MTPTPAGFDAPLRALDSSPPSRRPPVDGTDWGREIAQSITASPVVTRRARARRWVTVATAVAAACAVVALLGALIVSVGDERVPPTDGNGPVVVDAGALVETAYLGVSCPRANDPSCDEVGLSVTLRMPARSVTATIDGRSFALDDPDWSGPASPAGTRTIFAGFLVPAGFTEGALRIPESGASGGRWMGDPLVVAPIRLDIDGERGERSTVTLDVQLHPGWG